MMRIKTRLASIIGQRAYSLESSCGPKGHIQDFDNSIPHTEIFGHKFNCKNCGQEFQPSSISKKYDTPSGELEPGCLFIMDWFEQTLIWNDGNQSPCLGLVLPNGDHWNIDSRASNCTMPNDNNHRCWVRHGDPTKGENVHVDKNGKTCAAGAGSILMGGWHGFLHNGELYDC